MNRFRRLQAAVVLAALLLGGCHRSDLAELQANAAEDRAQAEARLQSISHIRLDAPLTRDNSVLLAFEDGPTLRVPKVLFDPKSLPNDPNHAFRARALALTFWYPDLTVTSLQSPTIPHKGTPGYVPQTDRFWVWIVYMWYVRPDSDSLLPGSKQPDDIKFAPRPPRIVINLWCLSSKNGRCDEMTRLDSGFDGIDSAISSDWVRRNPGIALPPDKRGVYVARPESPYELYMSCGLDCDATVYSKRHHFEYRMHFASEAAPRTDALIRTIDRMLNAWPIVADPPN